MSEVASAEADVSVEVAVPELVPPVNDDVNSIDVAAKSPSTIPSRVIDVELPSESGAKYIVVLLSIVDATISIPVAILKSFKS